MFEGGVDAWLWRLQVEKLTIMSEPSTSLEEETVSRSKYMLVVASRKRKRS